jgi:hypothetical protein
VRYATDDKNKVAWRTSRSAGMLPALPPHTPVAVIKQVVLTDDITKKQMVESLAVQSGMNVQWIKKCLIEYNWDFQQAMFSFNELNKAGKFPGEAFVQ